MGPFSATFLAKIKEFLFDHQQSLLNGVLVVVTLCGESIFRLTELECPTYQPISFYYGLCFMCGPAIILFILGILVNNSTWQLCQGCCHRKTLFSPSKHDHGRCATVESFGKLISKSMVAPVAWLFMALLDGNFYVCMMSSEPKKLKTPENDYLKSESQIISWVMLLLIMVLTAAGLIICRCCKEVSFLEARYMTIYQDQEQMMLETGLREKAKVQAESNSKSFIETAELCQKDWHCISMVPPNKVIPKIPKGSLYTSLERWDKERLDFHAQQPERSEETEEPK